MAPAFAVATWRGSISFPLAYAVGTMGAMSITTTLIGESTRYGGQVKLCIDQTYRKSSVSSRRFWLWLLVCSGVTLHLNKLNVTPRVYLNLFNSSKVSKLLHKILDNAFEEEAKTLKAS